jgi:hypothetical protein
VCYRRASPWASYPDETRDFHYAGPVGWRALGRAPNAPVAPAADYRR